MYEQSDSLKPVADKLKLEVRSAQGVTRTPQPGATGALANPKFLSALFSPDAIEHKRNTEAVFPTGQLTPPLDGTYGAGTTVTVPFSERNNPNFQGCLSEP